MEVTAREVVLSTIAFQSLEEVFEYGVETFAYPATAVFIDNLLIKIQQLGTAYLQYPESRHLATSSKMYRNLIYGSYLVIYRITDTRIEVLNILHSSRSVRTIRSTRTIKP